MERERGGRKSDHRRPCRRGWKPLWIRRSDRRWADRPFSRLPRKWEKIEEWEGKSDRSVNGVGLIVARSERYLYMMRKRELVPGHLMLPHPTRIGLFLYFYHIALYLYYLPHSNILLLFKKKIYFWHFFVNALYFVNLLYKITKLYFLLSNFNTILNIVKG